MVNSYDFELKGFLALSLRISNLTPHLISIGGWAFGRLGVRNTTRRFTLCQYNT